MQLFGDRLHLFVAVDDPALRGAVEERLGQAQIHLERLRATRYSIEDVFLRLT